MPLRRRADEAGVAKQSGRERRKLRRTVTRIPATFASGDTHGNGYVKNVSRGGVFLRTDTLPAPGAPVSILFHAPNGTKVEIAGVVRWTTDQLPEETNFAGFGMQLEGDNEAYLEFFDALLVG